MPFTVFLVITCNKNIKGKKEAHQASAEIYICSYKKPSTSLNTIINRSCIYSVNILTLKQDMQQHLSIYRKHSNKPENKK